MGLRKVDILIKDLYLMEEKIPDGECELIGALIGDGNIYTKSGKYQIGFTGHKIKDFEYFHFLKKLIKENWDKEVTVKIRENGARIQFYSKPTVKRLTEKFKVPCNEGKCWKVVIPEMIAQDWNLAKFAIRGIADSDGSVFTAKKPGSPNYPSVEITTTSINLAEQIRRILLSRGFRVANIWKYKSKLAVRDAYKVPLNGKENLRKWMDEIGFSNPVKRDIAFKALGQ